MKLGDLNKWFPVMEGLLEVKASTKTKPATMRVAIPNELANHLMKASCGIEVPIKALVIAYHEDKGHLDDRTI